MKKWISIILILATALLCGCKQNTKKQINDCYQITRDATNGYSYTVTDLSGDVLLHNSTSREPHISIINESILCVTLQAGTGLATRSTNYCNINIGAVSETFTSVLGEYENKVIFVDYKDGVHSIVVRDIFNKELYHKEIALDEVFVAADPVTSCNISESGTAEITYLKGSDYTKTTIYINLK